MNTLTKSFAKRVISMLLVTIMVFSLGIVGLTSASAANVELADTGASNVTGGQIYFDNTLTKWTDAYIYLVVGHGSYSKFYRMSALANTNLYFVNIDNLANPWNDADHFYIIGDDTSWGDGGFNISSKWSDITHHTGAYGDDYDLKTGSTYVFTPAGSSNDTALSIEGGTSYTTANTTNYVYAKSSTDGVNYESDATAGIVSISGRYMSNINTTSTRSAVSSTTSTHYNSTTLAQGSTATVTATPAAGYRFVGWYNAAASGGTCYSTDETYSYTVGKSTTYMYARFEKAVSIDSATATIGSEGGTSTSAVVGNPVDITVDYSVTGSTNTPTLTLCDASGNTIGNAYNVEINDKVITVTPPNAGDYTFKVKVEVDGVSEFTNEVTLEYKNEYSASLSVDVEGATAYTDDPFVFTLTDNADLYDSATYEVYCNDELVDVQWDGKSFTVSHSEAGDYTYIVKATVTDGTETKEVYTNDVKIAVKAKIFNIKLSSDVTAILENRDFTITATPEFAQGAVTYKIEATDGTLIEGNTDGTFELAAKDLAEGAGSEVITYTVTANDGNTEVTATIQITVNEDKGEFPVKIFFKCSDTYGYLPNAKINGAEVDLAVSDKIICYNATESATYSWYSYTSATNTPYGTDFVFEVNANRNYFYNVSYTVTAGEGKYDFDGTYYCYYLAIENLNGGTNTLTNISTMTEANRNWTYSAVNMIYDDADASVPVGLNYSYAAIADANTDGSVNIKDATYIQKNLAKAVEASELSELVSDVNGDGKVTIKDATAIQKQLAGL